MIGAGDAFTSECYRVPPTCTSGRPGAVLGWVRSLLGLEWDALYALTADTLAADDDPVFTPFLIGERDPRVGLAARAGWSNLSSRHDSAALGRSALLGVASYIAERTRSLMKVAGADQVVLSGGSVTTPAGCSC